MGIFRRNAAKLALIALIVFFSLPFIYGNEEENDFSPFAVKSGLSYQANPISKLANRIASFYGLSKPNMAAGRDNVDVTANIRGRIAGHHAFNKQDISNIADATAQNKNQAGPAADKQKLNNLEKDPSIYEPARETQMATTSTGVNYDRYYYNKPRNTPVVEYVQINGENYKVIQDITGHKYVATAKGHIPYEEVMRTTVSEREFLAAKKKLVNASDAEIVDYVLAQKQGTNNANREPQNYRDSYNDSYKGGHTSNMGNEAVQADNSFTTDFGFDDDMLSNVYASIKNIKVNGGVSSGSNGGSSNGGRNSGSSSGSSNGGRNGGNYYASSSGSQGVSGQDLGIISAIDSQVKEEVKNEKNYEQNKKTGTAVSHKGINGTETTYVDNGGLKAKGDTSKTGYVVLNNNTVTPVNNVAASVAIAAVGAGQAVSSVVTKAFSGVNQFNVSSNNENSTQNDHVNQVKNN